MDSDNPISNEHQTTEVVTTEQVKPLVVVSRRLLEIDGNGIPRLTHENLGSVDRSLVDAVNFSALLLPYKMRKVPDKTAIPDEDGMFPQVIAPDEERFEGMTNLEVAAIRAADQAAEGDNSVYKMLLERLAGKSVEKNLNVNTSVDYQTFLDSLGGKMNPSNQDIYELL